MLINIMDKKKKAPPTPPPSRLLDSSGSTIGLLHEDGRKEYFRNGKRPKRY